MVCRFNLVSIDKKYSMTKKPRQPLTVEEVGTKAKQVIKENPIYIKNEPSVVGSPDALSEDMEENDESADRKGR